MKLRGATFSFENLRPLMPLGVLWLPHPQWGVCSDQFYSRSSALCTVIQSHPLSGQKMNSVGFWPWANLMLLLGRPSWLSKFGAQCQERDTTGIADIGTIESLIRLGSTHEATKGLENFLGRDQQNRLSHILIHIIFELCGSLYMAVLDRRGEIPHDVFDCLSKVIKFSDDLLQLNPALENTANFDWLRNPS